MLLLHLKTLLRQLVLPPADLLLLAAAGLLLLRWHWRAGLALAWSAIAALWILSMPVVADAVTRLAERVAPLDPRQIPPAQAIVILGGGGQRAWAPEYRAASAAPELLERLAYGAWLAHRTDLPILVSGYGVEAQAMHDTLRDVFGLVPRWIDANAYDTFQNAQNCAGMLRPAGVQRILLVTRAAHMLRSQREFEAAGLTVTPAPVGGGRQGSSTALDYVPSADGLGLSYQAAYELLGEFVRQAFVTLHLRRHAPAS